VISACFASLIFGLVGGILAAMFMEMYFQRRAHDQVGDHDALGPTTEEGKRKAG
jgi:hypothetical protein